MPENMFRRIRHALIPVPHLARIFQIVASRLVEEPAGTLSLLNIATVHRDLQQDIRKMLRHDQWPNT